MIYDKFKFKIQVHIIAISVHLLDIFSSLLLTVAIATEAGLVS